jgi:hypothetical protein
MIPAVRSAQELSNNRPAGLNPFEDARRIQFSGQSDDRVTGLFDPVSA